MSEESKIILLVDDDPDELEYAATIVSEIGDFTIVTASDGEEGLEKARAEKPDLILLDVMMPKKDGFAVFKELRSDSATEGIPVIMLTAVSEKTGIKFSQATMGQFFGKEPEAFIDKPLDPLRVQEAAKKALGI